MPKPRRNNGRKKRRTKVPVTRHGKARLTESASAKFFIGGKLDTKRLKENEYESGRLSLRSTLPDIQGPTKFVVTLDPSIRNIQAVLQPDEFGFNTSVSGANVGTINFTGGHLEKLDDDQDCANKTISESSKVGCRKQSAPQKHVKQSERGNIRSADSEVQSKHCTDATPMGTHEATSTVEYRFRCGRNLPDAESLMSHKSLTHNEQKKLFQVNLSGMFSLQTFLSGELVPRNKVSLCDVSSLISDESSESKADNTFTFAISESRIDPELLKCETCQKTFIRKSDLTKHVATHIGKKTFSCDICGRTYAQRNHLSYHMITHAAMKYFKCEKCGKRFSSMLQFRRHSHTRFRCEFCKRMFSENDALYNHISVFHSK